MGSCRCVSRWPPWVGVVLAGAAGFGVGGGPNGLSVGVALHHTGVQRINRELIMDLTTIDPVWWIVLGGVILILLIGLLAWSSKRKASRTERLKGQFKSEYDRTTSSSSRKDAEEDLELRAARRSSVNLAEVNASDAASLQLRLEELRSAFVDGPQRAALGMTQLVERVAIARGYMAAESNVLDLVSVDHPEQVAAMRRSVRDMEQAKGAELTETSRRTFLATEVLTLRLLAEGRAGHQTDDIPEPPSATTLPLPSDDPSDLPPPPLDQDERSIAQPYPDAEAVSDTLPSVSDHPQDERTANR